ncbi:MAG TPA: hypothetical protein VJ860_18145, partial [Polyangia bacterium]|nr:hypothetical protein [Polyangia bacterium]
GDRGRDGGGDGGETVGPAALTSSQPADGFALTMSFRPCVGTGDRHTPTVCPHSDTNASVTATVLATVSVTVSVTATVSVTHTAPRYSELQVLPGYS